MSHKMCQYGTRLVRSLRSIVSGPPLLANTPLKVLRLQDTDVLYMKMFSKEFVVLNSPEAIHDLSEKRSAIYSDRVSNITKSLSYYILMAVCNVRLACNPDA